MKYNEGIITCETPVEWCKRIGVRSYSPLVSVIDYASIKEYSNPQGLCCGFYIVSLYCGDTACGVKYGRNMYDYRDGTLFFTAPGQTLMFTEYGQVYQPKENCLSLLFHPDFIRGSALADKMTAYRFFNYEVHEALHLSESEIEDIKRCFESIDKELKQRIDTHTATIVCSAIELLLNYCTRFYDRQFITRHSGNMDILSRFEVLLNEYFSYNMQNRIGLPTVKYFADKLNFSPDYLSSLLQKETGRSAQEHIQYRLIEIAKDKLHLSDKTVSQIAYELGFEYPQYFSRLFKKKVGLTPNEYKSLHNPQ